MAEAGERSAWFSGLRPPSALSNEKCLCYCESSNARASLALVPVAHARPRSKSIAEISLVPSSSAGFNAVSAATQLTQIASESDCMTYPRDLVVLERLSLGDRRGEIVSVRGRDAPSDEPSWRVAILPEHQPTLPHDAEMLQVDTVVSVIPGDIAVTADALAAIFSGSQFIGLDLPDIFLVAGGKTGGVGQGLVLKGVADPTMATTVQQWVDTIRSKGFRTKSMLIVQLLQEINFDDFGLQPFDDFCNAALTLCNMKDGVMTACGDASVTAVVIITFRDPL